MDVQVVDHVVVEELLDGRPVGTPVRPAVGAVVAAGGRGVRAAAPGDADPDEAPGEEPGVDAGEGAWEVGGEVALVVWLVTRR